MEMSREQLWAIKQEHKKRLLKLCPQLKNESGIYCWYRAREICFYAGQSVSLLNRSVAHLMQYDHLGLSIRKHGLYDPLKNPLGWRLTYYTCDKDELNEKERQEIAKCIAKGWTAYNITSGGQDSGKVDINKRKEAKSYKDGIKAGYDRAIGEISILFEKYLSVSIKGEKNKIKERKLNEFLEKIGKVGEK